MFIVVQPTNQLCNRLFLFAHLIAFSIEHNTQVWNLGFEPYSSQFKTTARDALVRFPAHGSFGFTSPQARDTARRWTIKLVNSLRYGRLAPRMSKRFRDYRSGTDTTLNDSRTETYLDSADFLNQWTRDQIILVYGPNFRAFQYFKRHESAIREYFRPLDVHMAAVNELIDNCRKKCDVLVGVHIRRGDYATWMGGRYFYSAEQFANVMRGLQEQFSNRRVGFLVCSNEAQDLDEFKDLQVWKGTGHFVQDLYSLARCDSIIGPPSTYSAWASFYGEVPLAFLNEVERPPALKEFHINHG